MLGARVESPSYLFGDNQAVVKSTTLPEFQFKEET